jgi:hypothetical protein
VAPAIVRAASLMPIKASLVFPRDGIALTSAAHPCRFTVTGYNLLGEFAIEEIEVVPRSQLVAGLRMWKDISSVSLSRG